MLGRRGLRAHPPGGRERSPTGGHPSPDGGAGSVRAARQGQAHEEAVIERVGVEGSPQDLGTLAEASQPQTRAGQIEAVLAPVKHYDE